LEQRVRICRLCGLLLLLGVLPSAEASEELVDLLRDPVTVELLSGRQFTATVDAKTDGESLWLQWNRGSARLLRPIAWHRVRRACVGHTWLDAPQFRQLVEASRPRVVPVLDRVSTQRLVLKGPPPDGRRGQDTADAGGSVNRREQTARVQSLAVDVRVANWDADVEVDGLIVEVYPQDAEGRVVAVAGRLDVELIVERTSAPIRRQPFARRGRWTEQVRVADFGLPGARFKLPFGSVGFHPELDRDHAPYGAVLVRLSVPGQGVFSATQSSVRIRPYSHVRDALEATRGKRFFPDEKTGSGRR
jgi:hypothetical protein